VIRGEPEAGRIARERREISAYLERAERKEHRKRRLLDRAELEVDAELDTQARLEADALGVELREYLARHDPHDTWGREELVHLRWCDLLLSEE
jgi:hypothetical protein